MAMNSGPISCRGLTQWGHGFLRFGAALAARDYDVAAVHISYGQRTEERERRSFVAICDRLRIRERLLVRNQALRAIGGSALTDPDIAVPRLGCRRHDAHSRHLCAFPQCAFSGGGGKLGRGAGGREGFDWRGRARQFGVSRLPSGVLRGVQPGGENRHQRGEDRDCDAADCAAQIADREAWP